MTGEEVDGIASWLTEAEGNALKKHRKGLELLEDLRVLDVMKLDVPGLHAYRDRVRGRAAWDVVYQGNEQRRGAYDAALAALDFILGLSVRNMQKMVNAATFYAGKGVKS